MAQIYSERQINGTLDIPTLRRDLFPIFRFGSAKTHNALAIQHAMSRKDLTVQLEQGEEYLVMPGMKARVIWPTGDDVDSNILFINRDLILDAPEIHPSAAVTASTPVAPESVSYVNLDMGAPTAPAAEEALMCGTCGVSFEGKMNKAHYAKHVKKHQQE